MSRYSNKRLHFRTTGGQFRKATGTDFGIGGACPTCHHLLLQHYYGDERERPVDPRKFVYRCFTCQPLTEAEQALKAEIEAAKPKPVSMIDFLRSAVERNEREEWLETHRPQTTLPRARTLADAEPEDFMP